MCRNLISRRLLMCAAPGQPWNSKQRGVYFTQEKAPTKLLQLRHRTAVTCSTSWFGGALCHCSHVQWKGFTPFTSPHPVLTLQHRFSARSDLWGSGAKANWVMIVWLKGSPSQFSDLWLVCDGEWVFLSLDTNWVGTPNSASLQMCSFWRVSQTALKLHSFV